MYSPHARRRRKLHIFSAGSHGKITESIELIQLNFENNCHTINNINFKSVQIWGISREANMKKRLTFLISDILKYVMPEHALNTRNKYYNFGKPGSHDMCLRRFKKP